MTKLIRIPGSHCHMRPDEVRWVRPKVGGVIVKIDGGYVVAIDTLTNQSPDELADLIGKAVNDAIESAASDNRSPSPMEDDSGPGPFPPAREVWMLERGKGGIPSFPELGIKVIPGKPLYANMASFEDATRIADNISHNFGINLRPVRIYPPYGYEIDPKNRDLTCKPHPPKEPDKPGEGMWDFLETPEGTKSETHAGPEVPLGIWMLFSSQLKCYLGIPGNTEMLASFASWPAAVRGADWFKDNHGIDSYPHRVK